MRIEAPEQIRETHQPMSDRKVERKSIEFASFLLATSPIFQENPSQAERLYALEDSSEDLSAFVQGVSETFGPDRVDWFVETIDKHYRDTSGLVNGDLAIRNKIIVSVDEIIDQREVESRSQEVQGSNTVPDKDRVFSKIVAMNAPMGIKSMMVSETRDFLDNLFGRTAWKPRKSGAPRGPGSHSRASRGKDISLLEISE